MRVHHRAVPPLVVGIAGHVTPVQRRPSRQDRVCPVDVASEVEGHQLRRAHLVVGDVHTTPERGAHFLFVPEYARAPADGRCLPVEVVVLQLDPPVHRVDEEHGGRELRVLRHPPRQSVCPIVFWQHEELRRARRRHLVAGLALEHRDGRLGAKRRRRLEVDAALERAEDREGHLPVGLADEVGAEHGDALVILVEALVLPARDHRVRLLLTELQLAAALHLHEGAIGRPHLADVGGSEAERAARALLRLDGDREHGEAGEKTERRGGEAGCVLHRHEISCAGKGPPLSRARRGGGCRGQKMTGR